MSTLSVSRQNDLAGNEQFHCKAWVNFNGTGTVAIRASGNVTSITDNGVGDYTVNITNALTDANFVAIATAQDDGAGAWGVVASRISGAAQTTTSTRIFLCKSSANSAVDVAEVHVAVFR